MHLSFNFDPIACSLFTLPNPFSSGLSKSFYQLISNSWCALWWCTCYPPKMEIFPQKEGGKQWSPRPTYQRQCWQTCNPWPQAPYTPVSHTWSSKVKIRDLIKELLIYYQFKLLPWHCWNCLVTFQINHNQWYEDYSHPRKIG